MNTLMQQYLVLRSMLTEKAEDETGAETIEIILGVIGVRTITVNIKAMSMMMFFMRPEASCSRAASSLSMRTRRFRPRARSGS